MQPLKVFSVIPKLPEGLEGLWELAYNLWFSWNSDIESIFSQMDQRLWQESYRNPVWFLNHVPQRTLEELSRDTFFKQRLSDAVAQLRQYVGRPSPHKFEQVPPGTPAVAYFSLEFGLALCLPIYSGGLGILAGDHLKSASDLNVPLVGIGIAYQQGYFRQYMTPDGWQQERYPVYDFEQMPMRPALTPDGQPAVVRVDVGNRPLAARIWQAAVGRVTLYLLDTNLPENPPDFRQITERLYGGNIEMRLWQEILLGIGGIKALKVLGIDPKVIHMNEGHSAFAGLERVRLYMKEHGLSFEAATEVAASGSIFTTHTPVPAGNDRFAPDLMYRYFEPYARDMGLAFKVFMALGREAPHDDAEPFCMTVLALRLSRANNGVSTLHGRVSRNMWKQVWHQFPMEDVPIGALTNGVHAPTWVAQDIGMLYDRYLGSNWREDPDCARAWSQVDTISDAEFWRTHERLRARLVDFVRERLRRQLAAQGARRQDIQMAEEMLNPEALTIGFARRFATYKRANLLLQDRERLERILGDRERPVQFIIAGKAHPQDQGGKQLIKDLIAFSRSQGANMSVVFLEDYDMEVASYLVSGCDVWLNNPRRPLEACGTSGMKAMLNGVVQFSTLDGWWDEAYRPDNSLGWAIGKGEEYDDPDYQDFVEMQTLYNILENDIIPEFYDRGRGGLPRSWIRRMKAALKELAPRYNSHRMVLDYLGTAYSPAHGYYMRLARDGFVPARELSEWRMEMMTKWSAVQIRNVRSRVEDTLHVGDSLRVEAELYLDDIAAEHVLVQLYAGPLGQDGSFSQRQLTVMTPEGERRDGWQLFSGSTRPAEAGRFGFTVRAAPVHPLLADPHSLGLIRWASPA
ncbi:alpha-glucan family phosphorylase [Nitratidesulfovibrio sp. D1]|uniref:alpha-glucan family phosphorylase n=1 Tax=Nitratidesulfovibrio sp. D1 TaxID=3440151 RepID=UPI003EBDFE77